MARELPFTAILGWSPTRYEHFSICKRRYFYHYYAKYDRQYPLRLICDLGKLVSIPLEVGGIVREIIAALLRRLARSQSRLDTERLYEFAAKTTERHVRSKRFRETYYGLLPRVTSEDLMPAVVQSLNNLLASDRWDWLVQEAAVRGDRWLIAPPGYGEARLGERKVFCKVDFLFPSDDLLYIIDWKTGKMEASKHHRQLLGSAAWATYHLGTPPERLRTSVAYLTPDYREIFRPITREDLDAFALQVDAETRAMYEYCRDVALNIPLEKESFPMVDDPRVCGQCNFRRLCFPEQYPSAAAG